MATQPAPRRIIPGVLLLFASFLAIHVAGVFADDTPAASAPPVYDIPRLPDFPIDANPSTWADRGLQIQVLHSTLPRPASSAFDAHLQLAWNERGLLVLADITDPDVLPEDLTATGGGPSLNVVLSDKVGGKLRSQSTIQITSDALHPAVQSTQIDQITFSHVFFDAGVSAASTKNKSGYVIEALLPWDSLHLKAQKDCEFALYIYVTPSAGPQLLWFGARSAESNTSKMNHVRLTDQPTAPVTAAADGQYEHFRHAVISIAAMSQQAGASAQIKTGQNLVGEIRLKPDGNLSLAQISLPMPSFGQHYDPLDILINGRRVDQVIFPDPDAQRKDATGNLNISCATVFKGPDFPPVDFADPGQAEKYFLTLYHPPRGFNFRTVRTKAGINFAPELGIDEAVAREQTLSQNAFLDRDFSVNSQHADDLAVLLCGLSEIPPGTSNLPRRLGAEGLNITWWYNLKKKLGDIAPYQYLVHVPDAAAQNPGQKFPLLLFLHGSGERGDNLSDVAANGPPKILKNQPDWRYKDQFIVVSPQCPANDRWNPLQLRDLLNDLQSKYPIDPDRVYLTGLSMGGFGTWQLAEWFPDRFAAIAPCCGGGDSADAARIKDLPTWVFHGGQDPEVPIFNAYEMVRALRDIRARTIHCLPPVWPQLLGTDVRRSRLLHLALSPKTRSTGAATIRSAGHPTGWRPIASFAQDLDPHPFSHYLVPL